MNVNTILLMALTAITTVCGWGLNRVYLQLERGQDELKSVVMPRQEIELRMDEMRVRITAIETELAKIKTKDHQ